VVARLDAAGVPVIEVSHGDGLGGSSFNYGFSHTNEMNLLRAAVEEARHSKIAVLMLPGIGIKEDLRKAADIGAKIARIATHCTEADISQQHIELGRELGMETVGFLMMAHMLAPDQLLEQAKKMESYGADCVYVVDSAGAMTIDDARRRVAAVKEGVDCQVGVHAHNNLTLAVANSLAALEEGVDQIDGCTTGLGAGAGNCPTEILVATCAKSGIETGVDPLKMMDAAEEAVRPIRPEQGVIDRDGLLLGYAGVYGSFLLHAKKAAERYGVDAKDILLELGERKVVGGQEDMIIDVAVELAAKAAAS
jgi:4-hydroxy 2-oxovalerate aldolase